MPKVRDDIGQCGPRDLNGQIIHLAEGRLQHLPLRLTFIYKLSKEPTNVQQRSRTRYEAGCCFSVMVRGGAPFKALTFRMEKPRIFPASSTFSMTASWSVSRKYPFLRAKSTSR